ncbi:MAG: shikimate kinase [Bacteroidia bacterium]|nr:shikimate kinase [Bacteroidia bacterium]MDW8236068.1 shikimate kinase [Bacteroidia bacterium]
MGKTTWGRYWAEKWQVPFYDTDEEIEKRSGICISQWFSQQGEPAFRAAERTIMYSLLVHEPPLIVATGGGLPTQEGMVDALSRAGYVVWIDLPWEKLRLRWRAAVSTRPLLQAYDDAQWRVLLEKRRFFYRQADLHWNPERIPSPIVERWVKRCLFFGCTFFRRGSALIV